jgi:hypothetical protein
VPPLVRMAAAKDKLDGLWVGSSDGGAVAVDLGATAATVATVCGCGTGSFNDSLPGRFISISMFTREMVRVTMSSVTALDVDGWTVVSTSPGDKSSSMSFLLPVVPIRKCNNTHTVSSRGWSNVGCEAQHLFQGSRLVGG